ncbi:MAG: tRNA (guanosine(37)-N1)-methyltransferase TrmD [Gammaproteobacteria bacterium]|nr:tRNA (guanosine(37)-N1)-methyltransferase TrmD [Gammaproteobacteria bacterium]
MWFGIVTLFPEMFSVATQVGVLGRAVGNGVLTVEFFNPRDYATDKHRTVDDRPYGGGPGMVMKVEPLCAAVAAAKVAAAEVAAAKVAATKNAGAKNAGAGTSISPRVIYLSAQGRRLNQHIVQQMVQSDALILLAGRYEGIDERAIDLVVDEELSIGDYVLTGGELPAMVLMDALARHVPGTLGNRASAMDESHLDGLLDYPHYTRPENAGDRNVPEVLLSGDHGAVKRWRRKAALAKTWRQRPDLLTGRTVSDEDVELLRELFDEELTPNP